MTSQDYFRPRGDITTVLDLTDRDAQDNTYFPIDTEGTFFHRSSVSRDTSASGDTMSTDRPHTVYPTTLSIQEFPQRGPAQWGQTLSFELGSLHAGDLLQGITLQVKLGSWYDSTVLQGLAQNTLTTSVSEVVPSGGRAVTSSAETTTAVLIQRPTTPQPIMISTILAVLWDTVDTEHSVGSTGLQYAAGLFTSHSHGPMTITVEYNLVLSQDGEGSTFVGVNGTSAVYGTTAVCGVSQVFQSITVTLQPLDTVGVYYMDNLSPTVLPSSYVSIIVNTTGATMYTLPSVASPYVPVGDSINYSHDYWTYVNSIGTSLVEYADFIVKDQTIERLTGEFIHTILTLGQDANAMFGIADSHGAIPYPELSQDVVGDTPFAPFRPYPTEDGTFFCVLPFFFFRTKLAEVFPLLSCQEGQVRIDIKLRPFEQMVRRFTGWRTNDLDGPLNQTVSLLSVPASVPPKRLVTTTASQPPAFQDFRILTACSYTTGTLRSRFLRQPFEQMVKLVQTFSFDEPLKYVVNKSTADRIEIQLPLELNHPVVELLWVFRRKATRINHEWTQFGPAVGYELSPSKVYPDWLQQASLRINGSEVISAEGDWFRRHIAEKHRGGWMAYQSHLYGYSFAERPDFHQPSGTANMSRATSVQLRLTVCPPMAAPLPVGCVFPQDIVGGWEVFVFAMHYNWLRFQNGICNVMFAD